jgi:hypothetical protein
MIGRRARIGAGKVVENLFRELTNLFLRGNLFKDRVLEDLLLNEIGQLQSSHLQHLDALPQLRR